jgi:hypothetical protein
MAAPELVGTNKASVAIEESLASLHVMAALKEKILNPQNFLPVTDVISRVSEDGKGTYREMTVNMPSGSSSRMIENIYHNDVDVVRFCVCGDNNEHVNFIHTDATGGRHLQFFKRNTSTLEPVHWPAPMAVAVGGIHKVLERARALAAGAAPAAMPPSESSA